MQFQPGKPFKIMQIADTQESDVVAKDTLKLINAALDLEKPDLVVLTGDQIKGYTPKFLTGDYVQKVRDTIAMIVKPMVDRNIPFAPTFGNHDAQGKVKKPAQVAMYLENEGCVPMDPQGEDCGTYTIPIRSSDNSRVAFNVYMIDSNADAPKGGYAPVRKDQIDWYRTQREALKEENGSYVPSMIFQHIPVPEYYDLFIKLKKKQKGAVKAYRAHKGYYILDPKKVWQQDYFLESVACPDENTGEFAAIKEKGDVFAMYAGHDHINSFVGKVDGIDLGYCPGAGFNVYGNGVDRAVRVFEIPEDNPAAYTTRTLRYRDIVAPKSGVPVKDIMFRYMPSSLESAVEMGLKVIGGLVGIGLIVWLLTWLLS